MELRELPLVVICACLIHMAASARTIKVDYLYYASPQTTDSAAGVYGGAVDFRNNGTVFNVIDHHCLKTKDGRKEELPVESLSYDPISGRFAVQIQETLSKRLTILNSTVCPQTAKPCLNDSNVLFYRFRTDHKVGPIAMYNSTIYFIYTVNTRDTTYHYSKIELRKLERNCHMELPAIGHTRDYNIEQCSKVVATLVDDQYEDYPGSKPTKALLVIANRKKQPIFFTQLQKLTYKNVKHLDRCSMELVYIDHRGRQKVLDSRSDIDKHYYKYPFQHLGGLAYRDGMICWSMADSIKCADWTRDRLTNPRTIVYPGNASKVCEGGAGSERMLGNLTTGVAISNAKDEVALYFGCIAESGLAGGAGLVRMPMTSQSARFYALGNATNPVLAGSMFVTQCDALAPEPKAVISGGKGTNGAVTWSPKLTWPLMVLMASLTSLTGTFML